MDDETRAKIIAIMNQYAEGAIMADEAVNAILMRMIEAGYLQEEVQNS